MGLQCSRSTCWSGCCSSTHLLWVKHRDKGSAGLRVFLLLQWLVCRCMQVNALVVISLLMPSLIFFHLHPPSWETPISVTGLLSLVEDFEPPGSSFKTPQKKHSKFMVIKVHIDRDRQYLHNIPFFFFFVRVCWATSWPVRSCKAAQCCDTLLCSAGDLFPTRFTLESSARTTAVERRDEELHISAAFLLRSCF